MFFFCEHVYTLVTFDLLFCCRISCIDQSVYITYIYIFQVKSSQDRNKQCWLIGV